jgi:hypothetical protein
MAVDDLLPPLTPDESAFRRMLAMQIRRYPRLEIQDLYKLILQAARGSEHVVSNLTIAHRWLARELLELADGPEEPIVDPISPDGCIVRINLRPYLAARGDPTALLEAFVRTVREYRGTEVTLYRYWRYAQHTAAAGLLPFAGEALRKFFVDMQADGFPAVHHSDMYTRTYCPAYRVIVNKFLAKIGCSTRRP